MKITLIRHTPGLMALSQNLKCMAKLSIAMLSAMPPLRFPLQVFATLLTLMLGLAGNIANAHGDEPHDDASASVTLIQHALPRVEMVGETTEVVAQLFHQRLRIYVSDWSSNTAIADAKVEVEWQTKTLATTFVGDGLYETAELSTIPSQDMALAISVQAEGHDELLEGDLVLAPIDAENQHSEASATAPSPGSLFYYMSLVTALLVGLLCGRWWGRNSVAVALIILAISAIPIPRAVAHGDDSHDEAKPIQARLQEAEEKPQRLSNGNLFVPKSVQFLLQIKTQKADFKQQAFSARFPAEIIADPNSQGLLQAPFRARILAFAKQLPEPGSRVHKGQMLLQLQAVFSGEETARMHAELARAQALLAANSKRLSALQAIRDSIAQRDYDNAQAEHDALVAQQHALDHALNGFTDVFAPMDGTIAVIKVRRGEIIDSGTSLIEIIADTLQVRAYAAPDFQARTHGRASFMIGGRQIAVRYSGSGQQLQDQQIPLFFNISDKEARLALGDTGQVLMETDILQNGVLVPGAAIVRDNDGAKAVFIKVNAEQFTMRAAHVQALPDGEFIIIEGIKGGERIVTEGAGLLAQWH